MNHSGQPAKAETSSSTGLLHWPPFWFFIFLALAVSAVSYTAFLRHSSNIRQGELNELSTIADLKVTEVAKWRKEREGDAEIFSRAPFFARAIEKWLQRGAPPDEDRQMIVERMRLMQSAYDYQEVFLFDAQGKPVLSATPGAVLPGAHTLERVRQAIQTQAVLFLDIGSSDDPGSMGMIAPVLAGHGGKSRTVGAAYLRMDPSRFLFPLLKAMPSDHKSMELVLVRREGDDVLFLNVSRAEDSSLLRQPLGQSKLPAAMAVLGAHTETEGADYRGVPVIAAMREIPGSGWFLVAKMEQEEIYAPLRKLAWLVAGTIIVLVTLTGAAMGLWWRSQRAQLLIAEQEQIEQGLRAASAYARSLIEASLDPLVTISAAGKITDVNEATERMTGVSRQQMIGSDFSEYFTEPEQARTGYQEVFAKGLVTDYPLSIRHVSGKVTDVLYNATVYRDEAGNIRGVFAAARDITERKRAEKDNQRLNRLYSLLSRTNKMIVRAQNRQVLFDEACRIAVDQGSFRMAWIGVVDEATHFIKPVAMNGNFGDYLKNIRISTDDIPEGRGPTGTALREGRHFVCKDIEHEPYMAPWREAALAMGYRSSAAFPLWVGGAVKGVFTAYAPEADWFNDEEIRLLDELASDISYALEGLEKESLRRQAEEEVLRLNIELERRVAERTASLEAANKDLEGFAYSVSHDLRVPLRAIDGFSRLVLKRYEDKLDDEGKRLLNVVRDNTKKMGQLIDDILAFSRAGRLEVKAAEVDMEALAREVWEGFEPPVAGRNVGLEIKPLPKVQGDAAMLRQVWANLLGNAVKFTNSRTTASIEIGSSTSDSECTFYVKDNGVGFDQQYVGKLFGVFQRLHGVDEFEGTGIGLAIVKRIIVRHGGRVWAEGKVNEGATFYFALPILREEQS
ncbi:MAG: GAF domain-containing protein [Gallionella sp.]|nr:GAF domain-containing protein [Gallionella sp.]